MSTFQTFQAVGNKEGLLDQLTYVSYTETPFLSGLRRVRVNSTYVEWLTQALASPTTNAVVEGAAYSAGTITARVRTGNYTQIARYCFTVSSTQEAILKAGIASEYAEQKKLKAQEMARDIEAALLDGTGNSGASGTARSIVGIRSWISTTNTTGSATGTQVLTFALLNECLAAIAAQNGNPTDIYVNSFNKQKISAMTGNASYSMQMADAKQIVATIQTIVTDFGNLRVHYHKQCTASEALILQQDMWEIGVLRDEPAHEVLPGAMSGMSFGAELEFTLISDNEKASGKITETTTS